MVESSQQIVNSVDSGALNLKQVDADKIGLWSRETLRLHLDVVLKGLIERAVALSQDDEDWETSSYADNMETAGFNEPAERLALGGVYNHLLMLGMIGKAD